MPIEIEVDHAVSRDELSRVHDAGGEFTSFAGPPIRHVLSFPNLAKLDAYLAAMIDYTLESEELRKQVNAYLESHRWRFEAAFARRI
jgi:hypothetical protein